MWTTVVSTFTRMPCVFKAADQIDGRPPLVYHPWRLGVEPHGQSRQALLPIRVLAGVVDGGRLSPNLSSHPIRRHRDALTNKAVAARQPDNGRRTFLAHP